MTEYKRGDRVKIVNAKFQPWVTELVGKFATVERDKGGYVTIRDRDLDPSNSGIWKSNLELVEKSLEDQLAEAEKIVARLKQKIEDAKPKAEKFPSGTVVKLSGDMHPGYMVKVSKDAWATLDKESKIERFDNIHVARDFNINDWGFEVIREGI